MRFRNLVAVLALSLATLATGQNVLAQSWEIVANLETPRHWHTTVQLQDGRLLVIGGITGTSRFMDGVSTDGMSLSSCEIYDPATGEVHAAASMNVPRSEFPAVLAPDGSVYVFGGLEGEAQRGVCTELIERYDPATDQWTVVGNMMSDRRRHAAVMYDDRHVLICAGAREDRVTYGDSEIFDIVTGQTIETSDMPQHLKEGVLSLIDDGVPAYIGGREGGGNSPRQKQVYLFNTVDRTWYAAPQPPNMPGIVTGTVVNNAIIACGGTDSEIPYSFSKGVYLVENGEAREVIQMDEGRGYHAMVPIGGRTVLISGGFRSDQSTVASSLAIDLLTNQIVVKPDHIVSRAYHTLHRFDHPNQGVVFYAVSGMTNKRIVLREPDSLGRGGRYEDEPRLTPTIEMLRVGSEAKLLARITGVNEDDQSVHVRAYPNPVTDVLTVSAPEGSTVRLYDIAGAVVREAVMHGGDVQLTVADLPTAAYLVVIDGPAGTTSRPILKR